MVMAGYVGGALPHGVLVEPGHLADGAVLHLRPLAGHVVRDGHRLLLFDVPRVETRCAWEPSSARAPTAP